MDKKVILTYSFRIIGAILVLVYFFGKSFLYRTFPGLQGYSMNSIFYVGVLIYVAGAILYYVFNRKKPKKSEENFGDNDK